MLILIVDAIKNHQSCCSNRFIYYIIDILVNLKYNLDDRLGGAPLEICYANKRLQKVLEDDLLIKKEYSHCANSVMARMTELRFAANLSLISTFPPPCRHKLSGSYKDCWAVSCSANYRLVFRPVGQTNELLPLLITKIEILEIADYH